MPPGRSLQRLIVLRILPLHGALRHQRMLVLQVTRRPCQCRALNLTSRYAKPYAPQTLQQDGYRGNTHPTPESKLLTFDSCNFRIYKRRRYTRVHGDQAEIKAISVCWYIFRDTQVTLVQNPFNAEMGVLNYILREHDPTLLEEEGGVLAGVRPHRLHKAL